LILLQETAGFDFEMKYYNADGNESTMCGNGGRCVVMFASQLGIIKEHTTFLAIDGPHQGRLLPNGEVSLQMGDVDSIQRDQDAYVLNTGSPHYVKQVDLVSSVEVFAEGKAIRNSPAYKDGGINVNFLEVADKNHLKVRTYERGVEDETYACGTGVTACAIVASQLTGKGPGQYQYQIDTLGGKLGVSYQWDGHSATDVWLTGPAVNVFEGVLSVAL
jgi:diaminopimelate epimerase